MQCTKHYLKPEILTDLDRIYEWRGSIQLLIQTIGIVELNRSHVWIMDEWSVTLRDAECSELTLK